jgi:hypothetical protein
MLINDAWKIQGLREKKNSEEMLAPIINHWCFPGMFLLCC